MKQLLNIAGLAILMLGASQNLYSQSADSEGKGKWYKQSNPNAWEIGAGIGYTNYYGDLSNYRILKGKDLYKVYRFAAFNRNYVNRPSFSLLAQKQLNNTIGVLLQANVLQFEMSDRYQKHNGDIDPNALHFNRALNFRTNLADLGFALTFSPDNGSIFPQPAFFYPSFYVGMGIAAFSVKGDLYDQNGNPYNYTAPGNINDGSFETNLRDLNTERDKHYSNVSPFINLGLALNFRINESFRVALQSDIRYSGSDYLDDVSKTYKTNYPSVEAGYAARPGSNVVNPVTLQRGDNNGVNDVYINNRFVVFYNLHPKKKTSTFKAPVVYSISRVDTGIYSRALRTSLTSDTGFNKKPGFFGQRQPLQRQNATGNKTSKNPGRQDRTMFDDSIRLRDSIFNVLNRISADTGYRQLSDERLNSIERELRDMKTVIRNQALIPRYNYLQYQLDSISRLSTVVANKRVRANTDNLQLRVYRLQQDSLRNEMQKLLWISQYPAQSLDSATLHFDPYTSAQSWKQTIDSSVVIDSAIRRSNDSVLQNYKAPKELDEQPAISDSIQSKTLRRNNDSAYKKQVDSLTRLNQKNINRLYQRLDSLEKAAVQRPAELYADSLGEQASAAVNSTAQIDSGRLAQSAAVIDESTRQAQIETTRRLDSAERVLQRSNDSLVALRNSMKVSKDSAAYYRRSLFALDIDETDTVVEKRKWYQKIIPKSKKQKADETTLNEAKSYRSQETYYDAQAKNMSRDIERLQQDNRNLQDNYNQLRRRQNDRIITQSPPIVVQGNRDNSSAREIRELRDEISALKIRMSVPVTSTQAGVAAAGDLPDSTAKLASSPAMQQPVGDSVQITNLRADLAGMRKELDSLRRVPVRVVAPVKDTVADYDVTGFPVISVYFGMNSSTLQGTQTDKISPLAVVARKNKTAKILLSGSADPVGNVNTNKALATRRMEHVKSILVTKYGLPESRIELQEPEIPVTKGIKKANPLDRRVDLRFK